jgi:hypothetical protein
MQFEASTSVASILHHAGAPHPMAIGAGSGSDRRWRSRATAFAWWLSTVAFLFAGGCLVFASVNDIRRTARVLPPKPPEVATDVVVKNVTDQSGREASFRILLFTDEFRWRLSSRTSLENGLAEPEFTPEMKAVLNDAKEIICVGASSEEIPKNLSLARGRANEEWRAARRAEQIAMWVHESMSRPIPVRKLNIGHHSRSKEHARSTSDQRRVVIILVLEQDERTDIDQALRAAMERESARVPVFDALLREYSLAVPAGFTWVE